MTKFRDDLAERLKDENVRKEYIALEPEYATIQAIIDAREDAGMSLEDLARATGIKANNISRIENGRGNPTLRTLKRLAEGMNKTLEIKFA